ncbi:hypothetical protein DIE28_03035 [Paracoccus thiocyanatus]|uniref:Lipoprotein n=2 Tax=Paracoccus thiocyanatus TaxID=34006 RepID=A0A3D8PGL4_9RHOB|nr:hypothetical protein DIE28_03035 [Paracoccus thiocyanatus]
MHRTFLCFASLSLPLMLLSACDTSGLDPATADQVNQSEMTAAVGLLAAAFGGDAYRDAGLQVASDSLNDAATRRAAAAGALAGPASGSGSGGLIHQATTALNAPPPASASASGAAGGGSMLGNGKCEQRPQCRAASNRFTDYSKRLTALAARSESSVHISAKMTWCAANKGIDALETCLGEARAASDSGCVADIQVALQDTRRLAAEARQTANQSYAYNPDGWMASCPS